MSRRSTTALAARRRGGSRTDPEAATNAADRGTGMAALAGIAGMLGAAIVLHRAGGVLPVPTLDPSTWSEWLDDVGPTAAALALLRLVAFAALAYLVVVATLVIGLRLAGQGRAAARVLRLAPVGLRRLLAASLGLTLALPGLAPVSADPAPSETATMRVIEAPASSVAPTTTPPTTAPPTTAPPTTAAPPTEPPTTTPPTTTPAAPSTATARTHVVEPGEHLWGIARCVLTAASGEPPSEAEVLAYVERLVTANAATFVVPGDPDLILPGQVFTLPDPGELSGA